MSFYKNGMSTLIEISKTPMATNVWFEDTMLCVALLDGREIKVPITWFPRLSNAKLNELENWKFIGKGQGIHWPDLDEDLSVAGLFIV